MSDKAAGKREKNQAIVDSKIRACARDELASVGPVALSMRAIAREAGMASSAIYRYYPTREALLTALIVESYAELAAALEAVTIAPGLYRSCWTLRANALRDWALATRTSSPSTAPDPDYRPPGPSDGRAGPAASWTSPRGAGPVDDELAAQLNPRWRPRGRHPGRVVASSATSPRADGPFHRRPILPTCCGRT